MSDNNHTTASTESPQSNEETNDERQSSDSLKTTVATIMITSVLTTLGTLAVTTYQQNEQQNIWLAQQKYIEKSKNKDEKKKIYEQLIDLNSKKSNLKSDFFLLYFQAQVPPSLNPTLDEEFIESIKKKSTELGKAKTSLSKINSDFINLLVKSRILFNDGKSNEIINLIKHDSSSIPVIDIVKEFNRRVEKGEITSSNFDEMYIKYALKSSEAANDEKYNEKFNKMIKYMIDNYRQE